MLEEIEIGDPESPNIRPVQPNQFTGSGSSHPPSTAGITFVTVEFVNASIVISSPFPLLSIYIGFT